MAAFPAVADQSVNALMDRAAPNVPGPDTLTDIGRTRKRSRVAADGCMTHHLVTSPELGKVVLDEFAAIAAHGVAVPGAAPHNVALQHTVNQLQHTVNQLQQTINQVLLLQNNMAQQLHTITIIASNSLAMSRNASATHASDPLTALLLPGFPPAAPPNFPATRGALSALSQPALRALLVAYGLPPNPQSTRELRFKQWIGVRL